MIRLVGLTMDNIRNVNHGKIRFHTLADGGSLTGIYGQNGSGKTTVIDAIRILKTLMSGLPLDSNAMEAINVERPDMRLEAVFLVHGVYVSYKAEITGTEDSIALVRETVKASSNRERLGRPLLDWTPSDDTTLDLRPRRLWDSITSEPSDNAALRFANRDARRESRSFVFSEDLHRMLAVTKHSGQDSEKTPSLKRLGGLLENLHDYAQNDIAILTTRRAGYVTQQWMPLAADDGNGGYDDRLFDLMKESGTVSVGDAKRLHDLIDTFNIILPALIPGLTLELAEQGRDDTDDGAPGVRVSLRSVRNNRRIPFRKESEGVQRIVSMLTYLIHAYNDPDACIAIDELDTGVYEHLLGEIIREFTHARGQLIFTAHNLRILETTAQPRRTIVLTTIDSDNRFVPFRHVGNTENGRHRYLTNIETSSDARILYEVPSNALIRSAFQVAGNASMQRDVADLRKKAAESQPDPTVEMLSEALL